MARRLIGYSWSCKRCGAWADGYRTDNEVTYALIVHTSRCRWCPSGQTVSNSHGRIVWTKG